MNVNVFTWTTFLLVLECIQLGVAFITNPSCSTSKISCKSGNQCVNLHDVCTNGRQCSDGSDEDPRICSFWKLNDRSSCRSRGQYYCIGHSCQTMYNFCNKPTCANQKDSRICKVIKSRILHLEPEEEPEIHLEPEEEPEIHLEPEEEPGMHLTEELMNLMGTAVNISLKSEASCPMFYSKVEGACLSFFSPARVPWPEARQFCISIGGDLISIGKDISQEKLLQYMGKSQLTTSYWIGGRYDIDTNAWSWVNDDTPMPLGSPFWATKYSSSCVPRSPPHTDPFSPPPEALTDAPCYHYTQAPAKRSSGWCAAITYEHFYYITDETCQDTNKSPLCFYNKKEKPT